MARRDYFYDPEAPKPNSIRPAAAVALFDSGGNILLLRRKDNDKWTMPGGTLDFGESLTSCAIREVREETGLQRIEQIAQAHSVTDDLALIEPLVLTTKCLVAQLRHFNRAINEFDHKITELFKSHPDHFLFESLPGAGEQLAPRLLSLFGSDRSRWAGATDIQKYSGIAPVVERSGRSPVSHRSTRRSEHLDMPVNFRENSVRITGWMLSRRSLRGRKKHPARFR